MSDSFAERLSDSLALSRFIRGGDEAVRRAYARVLRQANVYASALDRIARRDVVNHSVTLQEENDIMRKVAREALKGVE